MASVQITSQVNMGLDQLLSGVAQVETDVICTTIPYRQRPERKMLTRSQSPSRLAAANRPLLNH